MWGLRPNLYRLFSYSWRKCELSLCFIALLLTHLATPQLLPFVPLLWSALLAAMANLALDEVKATHHRVTNAKSTAHLDKTLAAWPAIFEQNSYILLKSFEGRFNTDRQQRPFAWIDILFDNWIYLGNTDHCLAAGAAFNLFAMMSWWVQPNVFLQSTLVSQICHCCSSVFSKVSENAAWPLTKAKCKPCNYQDRSVCRFYNWLSPLSPHSQPLCWGSDWKPSISKAASRKKTLDGRGVRVKQYI